jgi:cytochrome c
MKKLFLFTLTILFVLACGNNESGSASSTDKTKKDDGKGIGEITNVSLNTPLKATMVQKGEAIYEMKCAACHKTTGQRVVGPGFAEITTRRKPEWIMNMITNIEVMLAEDEAAQALLKECLVRMPNQNLSIGDARDVLEWLYANDGNEIGAN